MAREGRFVLDGKSYEHRSAAIVGEFDIDPDDLDAVNYDDTLVLVVIGRVGPPTFKELSNGDLKRVDKIQLGGTPQVRVAKGEPGYEIADMYGLEVAQQFEVGDPDPFRDEDLAEREEDAEEEREEEPEPEPEPEPAPAPAKAAKKAAKAKKAPSKKAAAKKAAAPAKPVTPPSADVGTHVGGAMANDAKLRDFMAEPV